MTWRLLFGDLGDGQFGVKVSKPGFDVRTALSGDLLFDSSSICYQRVLSGETILASNHSAGTFNVSVPLPSEYAAYSNLQMWVTLYQKVRYSVQTPPVAVDKDFDLTTRTGTTLKFHVESGVLYFNLVTDIPTTTGVNHLITNQIIAPWSIFNAQVSP